MACETLILEKFSYFLEKVRLVYSIGSCVKPAHGPGVAQLTDFAAKEANSPEGRGTGMVSYLRLLSVSGN